MILWIRVEYYIPVKGILWWETKFGGKPVSGAKPLEWLQALSLYLLFFICFASAKLLIFLIKSYPTYMNLQFIDEEKQMRIGGVVVLVDGG